MNNDSIVISGAWKWSRQQFLSSCRQPSSHTIYQFAVQQTTQLNNSIKPTKMWMRPTLIEKCLTLDIAAEWIASSIFQFKYDVHCTNTQSIIICSTIITLTCTCCCSLEFLFYSYFFTLVFVCSFEADDSMLMREK